MYTFPFLLAITYEMRFKYLINKKVKRQNR